MGMILLGAVCRATGHKKRKCTYSLPRPRPSSPPPRSGLPHTWRDACCGAARHGTSQ